MHLALSRGSMTWQTVFLFRPKQNVFQHVCSELAVRSVPLLSRSTQWNKLCKRLKRGELQRLDEIFLSGSTVPERHTVSLIVDDTSPLRGKRSHTDTRASLPNPGVTRFPCVDSLRQPGRVEVLLHAAVEVCQALRRAHERLLRPALVAENVLLIGSALVSSHAECVWEDDWDGTARCNGGGQG